MIRISWNRTALLLYKPDILASKHYQKNYREAKWAEPEKALMFAVLMEAVETYQRFGFSTSPSEQKLLGEAKAWFWDEEVDRIFSFRSICGVIGLEPVYLRRGLRQWAADPQHEKSCRKRVLLQSISRTRKPIISL